MKQVIKHIVTKCHACTHDRREANLLNNLLNSLEQETSSLEATYKLKKFTELQNKL